ncbi:MAG: hypothetical protein DWQ40_04620 [Actinobacteria bacterium]|nr:MAG: hypothetical protein DWQ40_04620 [Actinomycetota bacterium]
MKKVEVKRSGWRMWWMALGAIPLLVIGLDVLTNRRITNWLREIVFRPEDTQIYEPRDVIWAWGLTLFAGLIILWALKELFIPAAVVETRPEGLALKLRGPFRPVDLVPWENIKDVEGGEIDDEEDALPLLAVEVNNRDGLPDHPWGARWLDARVLGVLAQDWPTGPDEVARQIGEYAVAAAEEIRKKRVSSVWREE